jgi:pathogenesis-related protein 1
MARITTIRIFLFAIGVAVVTTASAQQGPIASAAAGKARLGLPAGPMASATEPPTRPVQHRLPATSAPVVAASEPRELTGMLAAHNDIRARLGIAGLAWSSALEAEARTLVTKGADTSCTFSDSHKDLRSEATSVYWTGPIRQSDGEKTAQTLAPAFVVSEWQQGVAGYDATSGACKKTGGVCDDYARIVAPQARQVGCARTICPTQAQIWVCRYDQPPRSTSNASGPN